MIISNGKFNELNNISNEEVYVITDFDGTITKNSNDSSWASIFKNPNVTEEFVQECIRIFNYYHKFEIDESIPLAEKISIMNEWYIRNIETLKRFGITEEIINYSANNESIISFREGAPEFLKKMNELNIPIIIISAGVGNIIQQFLINNNCNYPNIYICSNFLEYENGLIQSIRDNNLIHPLNKNEVSLTKHIQDRIVNRGNAILLGNAISDIKMASTRKKVYKIGFLDEEVEERIDTFKANYDIVCTNNTSYHELISFLQRGRNEEGR